MEAEISEGPSLLNPYAAFLKPWHMGTHLRVLSESYPMNFNMAGFRWFS